MTRHEIRLSLRRPPWLIRAIRHVRNPDGAWPECDSKPWWFHWFAVVVPYPLRRLHCWYAARRGLFWKPCPLCGAEFGGHEWRPVGGLVASVPDPLQSPAGSMGICPRCTRAGRGRAVDLAGGEL